MTAMSENGLYTENLTIGYKSDLVERIHLEVRPGRIVTLIGPNGCGKSTLLKTLCGFLRTRGGSVYLNGRAMASLKPQEIARELSLVMTTQVKPAYMTCREVIETGRYPYTGMLGILSDRDRALTDQVLAITHTEDVAEKPFGSISDGQRQRVMLARAICQEPKVLVLDEPTSYLDIRYRLDILMQIRQFVRDTHMAVIMSLHELDIAMRISDTVIAMGDGKIQKTGPPEAVFQEGFIRRLFGIEGMDTSLLGNDPWFAPEPALTPQVPEAGAGYREKRARVIMIQGTMSNVGKSLLVAGLCRIFKQDGYKTVPFKSQNMALNSFITEDGLEMGRAQVVQAECCGLSPMAIMNPVLLKPVNDQGSQVIVNGRPIGNMTAAEYYKRKKELIPEIQRAYHELAGMADIIVVEGAGSPVELNLKDHDLVNMGLAELIDAPVLLAGDIDRGGIFAQLIGTLSLLTPAERDRVKGLIVNKFRGDRSLFQEGVEILQTRSRKAVVGVVPYMDVRIDEEDSLSGQFAGTYMGGLDLAVIRLPHISNFTDLDVFRQIPEVSVRYVKEADRLGTPDVLVIPGTKNTIGDLRWLREKGLDREILRLKDEGCILFGICGGYQMLGRKISDPYDTESGMSDTGLGLLPVDTVMDREKTRTLYEGFIEDAEGALKALKGAGVKGYEIHTGRTVPYEEVRVFTSGSTGYCRNNIYGTYIHGFFDSREVCTGFLSAAAACRGLQIDLQTVKDMKAYKEEQYDRLAEQLRRHLDMDRIYRIMGLRNGNV